MWPEIRPRILAYKTRYDYEGIPYLYFMLSGFWLLGAILLEYFMHRVKATIGVARSSLYEYLNCRECQLALLSHLAIASFYK